MATRLLLNELAAAYAERTGTRLELESVGGVDAATRVQAGEPFDVVLLASDAIDKLIAGGSAVAGTRVDLVHSGVSIAVREGAAKPDVATEPALRQAVLAAPGIGYSTGPSGTALLKLFDRWGITPQLQGRLMQAPAGIPVGELVEKGDVALGFQQLSELIHLPGITIVGPMPQAVEIDTIFAGAVCTTSQRADEVRKLLAWFACPDTAKAKRRQGMQPA